MQWGVRAYNEWRNQKITDLESYDYSLFEADLNTGFPLRLENLENLEK